MTRPHQGQPVLSAGEPAASARVGVVLVHGRGADANSMLSLADALRSEGIAFRAPQASGFTWYPHSFLAPLSDNEPWLGSAVHAVLDVVAELEGEGIPADRIVLVGFSQGACLALETSARHTRRYGGVVALSGGLIGSDQRTGGAPPDDKLFEYEGSLHGTPVFLGCSDVDAHIPVARVHKTAQVMSDLDADVTTRIYPGMGHTVNDDELRFVRGLLDSFEPR